MAIHSNIYGDTGICYKGCVIDMFEHNGRDDSDFYAVCWDEKEGKVVTVEYDTTRCGGGGVAEIDATDDVLAKVYRYYKAKAKQAFDSYVNEDLAKAISKGDEVEVVRGRKVAKGSVGKVFWIGTCYNQFSYRTEERVGLIINGEKVFLPLEYVAKCNWESCLLTGKARKAAIRARAIGDMPYRYRSVFA